MRRRVVLIQQSVCLATSMLFWIPSSSSGQVMSVRSELRHDVSPAVRDLPVAVLSQVLEHEAEPVRLVPLPPGLKRREDPDPVLQKALPSTDPGAKAAAPLAPQVGLGFDSIGQGVFGFGVNVAPPDTNGAVGLNQYVQWVNIAFAVFDKKTGNLIKGPVAGNSLWQHFGGVCEATNRGDPVVSYDKLANRWVF